MRPEELAPDLGISAKHLRHWLRETYARPASLKHKPWHLSPSQVAAARAQFSTRHVRAETRKDMVVTTVALSKVMHRRLASAAIAENTVMTELVRRAVAEWLERRRKG